VGSINRRIVVQDSPDRNKTLFKKYLKTKRAMGEAQVEEHIASKCKVLNSKPSTTKQKRKRYCIFSF
jgi:hypothetical protein